MSVGDAVGLIFAVGFLVLVALLGYPLVKLGKVFDETRLHRARASRKGRCRS